MPFSLRAALRSKNTLPLQTTTRFTFSGLMLSSHSPLTALNLLSANSASGDTDSLCRSRLFGVKMTSGLRYGRIICRRSRKNICTGVAGTQTCML